MIRIPRNFADRLLDAIDEKQNPSCVGLDPTIDEVPTFLKEGVMNEYGVKDASPEQREQRLFEATAEALFRFNKAIIDGVYELVGVVKPQIAFYECYGAAGIQIFLKTVRYAKQKGLIVVEDAKREDIGKTASFYAKGHLGQVEMIDSSLLPNFDVDAMTLGPYIGFDSIGEFVKVCKEHGKGAIVLAKTSNPSAGEFQDKRFADQYGGRLLYEDVALKIDVWGRELLGERGYSSLCAVVGATWPEEATRCREMMPNTIFLVPGYGTQGGTGKDTMPNFNEDGYGAFPNNASALTFAYRREPYKLKFKERDFVDAARQATIDMRNDIVGAMQAAKKLPSGWARV